MTTTNTPLTQTIDEALRLLRGGEHLAAHLLLADALQSDPDNNRLLRIANLIQPCGMVMEAIDGLERWKLDHAGPGPNS